MGFFSEIGDLFTDGVDSLGGLWDDLSGSSSADAIKEADAISNDAALRRIELLQPFLDAGQKFIDPVSEASTLEGLDGRLGRIMDSSTFKNMFNERLNSTSNFLDSVGLSRSGFGAEQISQIPVDLAAALESQMFGRQQNMLNMGQNSAAGVGNIIGERGQNQGQSIIDQAAAGANGTQNLIDTGGSIASMVMTMFSDSELKTNVRKIGDYKGQNIYEWDWIDEAPSHVKSQLGYGFMADEIEPDHKGVFGGYETVDYASKIQGLAV